MSAQIVLDVGRSLFVGPLDSVPRHAAAVDAVLVGLERPFELIVGGAVRTCEAVVVPARTEHALEFHGGRVAVLYVEPGCQVGHELDAAALRSSVDAALVRGDPSSWQQLLAAAQLEVATGPIDARVARVASLLSEAPDESLSADVLAARVRLSVSRLEHLFKAQLGVPLRAYRGWYRMRLAAERVLAGASLTEAAHAAGFYDSAHFNHAFRQTFGLKPSLIFRADLARR